MMFPSATMVFGEKEVWPVATITSAMKGRDLYHSGGITNVIETSQFYHCTVNSRPGHAYFVSIKKTTNQENCTCVFGSIWRFTNTVTPKACKHIWACRYWLQERAANGGLQGTNEDREKMPEERGY